MQKRVLGKTGLRVTPFCLGAMMFGEVGNTDHGDCVLLPKLQEEQPGLE